MYYQQMKTKMVSVSIIIIVFRIKMLCTRILSIRKKSGSQSFDKAIHFINTIQISNILYNRSGVDLHSIQQHLKNNKIQFQFHQPYAVNVRHSYFFQHVH